jgi:hypothetical protein
MYLVGFLFAFSGDLLTQIQLVRQHNQIQKTNHIVTISLLSKQWNAMGDQHEIKCNGAYYDVVSHSRSGKTVTIKAVKDHFENEMRIVLSQIFNKSKNPKSEKKKTNFTSHQILTETKSTGFEINLFPSVCEENFKSNFDLKINSFIYLPQKPPCI